MPGRPGRRRPRRRRRGRRRSVPPRGSPPSRRRRPGCGRRRSRPAPAPRVRCRARSRCPPPRLLRRDVEGGRQGERAGVQGFADDRALEAVRHELAQGTEVVERRDPARGDDGLVGAVTDLAEELDVRPLQRAVLRDVGDDVPGAPGGLEPVEHLPQVPGVLGPPAARQGGAADVEADGDLLAVLADDARRPLRLLERGGAEVDAGGPGRERGLQRGVVADAAGQLDRDALDLVDRLRDQPAVVAAAERRVEVDEVDPLGTLVAPGAGRGDRVAVRGLAAGLALREADRLTVDDVDGGQQDEGRGGGEVGHGPVGSVAGAVTRVVGAAGRHGSAPAVPSRRTRCRSGSERVDPVAEQPDARLAGLLGVELGRGERAVLDRRDEALPVLGPRQPRGAEGAVGVEREVGDAVGVHEVEALVVQAVEQHGVLRCLDGVPPHVRQHLGPDLLDGARPLAETLDVRAALHTAGEHDLHADADAEYRSPAGQAVVDDLAAAHPLELVDDRGERAHARHEQAVRAQGLLLVGGERHVGTGTLERLRRRVDVPRPVVEDDDVRPGAHSAPFVDGIPSTRGSSSTARRIARAKALNSASAMWCGSRPPRTRTCTVIPALNVIASNTCRTIDPVKWPPMRWNSKPSGSPECTRNGRPDTSTTACARASSSGTSASP
ncbi:hypothetical protein Cus16_3128 [Curtobacterium sp. ER1/6]|nr:hypothetical protein Cus16_3128 [Curtobacterium sp. ER1/6]